MVLLPGHGWSPCPSGTTVASYAAELAATITDPVDLLGYSMGGRIALQLALDHPDKVQRLIRSACDPASPTARSAMPGDGATRPRHRSSTRTASAPSSPGGRTDGPASGAQDIRSLSVNLRYRRLNHDPRGLADALRGLGQAAMDPLWDRLDELEMPVQLIAGKADPTFCADMLAMQKAIIDAHFFAIPGVGHAVHREDPEALLACLEDFRSA